MLGDISKADHVYIAVGYTDMRKGIDGLAAIVQQNFKLDPFSNSVYLFCGRKYYDKGNVKSGTQHELS